ncbi:MAG: ComEC/Rec2 family competence protein [Spirochaetia bacterium]|nr:ComEC/Rec2 family competence protein [Spirochaetia bacterium]
MFTGTLFLTYIAVVLLSSAIVPFYVKIFFLFLPFFFFYFWYLNFNCARNFIITSFISGLIIGALAGIFSARSFQNDNHIIFENKIIKNTGVVYQYSNKSIVVKTEDYRLRLSSLPDNMPKILNGFVISFECSPKKYDTISTFTALEILQGIYGICYTKQLELVSEPTGFEKLRLKIYSHIENRLNSLPENSLAKGFLLADSSSINPKEMEIFRKMGTAHLFSASGLHLGLLYGLFFLPFSFFGYKKTGAISGLLISLLFLILLDFRISLLRAFLFLSIYLLLKTTDRKPPAYLALFSAAVFIEIFFPRSSFSPSFILSFGITASILFLFEYFREYFLIKNQYLKDHLSLSVSAFCGSVFLSLWLFDYIHALSLLYNFLLVPISGIYLASVIFSLFLPYIEYLVKALDEIFHFFSFAHNFLWNSRFPEINYLYTAIWAVLFYICLCAFIYYAYKKQFWIIRKQNLILFILFISYFGQYFFFQYPKTAVKPFAHGILYFENRNLIAMGQKASYIAENSAQKIFNTSGLPVCNVISDLSLAKESKKYLVTPWENITIKENTFDKDFISYNNRCFLFYAKMNPENWKKDKFSSCQSLFLIQSKNDKINLEEWYDFFMLFGLKNKPKLLSYNKWNYD